MESAPSVSSLSSLQPFVPTTTQEWYTFIQLFKQTPDTRHLILHSNNEAGLLDNIVKTVGNKLEKDDVLKVNLLVFLQENANYFFEEDPKRYYCCFCMRNTEWIQECVILSGLG